MKVDLEAPYWRILRALVRQKELTGSDLRRFYWSRFTKDGSFLNKLEERGLIRRLRLLPVPSESKPSEKDKPVQFRTVYGLTEEGEIAAEYGEYTRTDPVRVPEKASKKKRSRSR